MMMDYDNSMDMVQMDEGQPRTLYVGNLDPSMTEDFIVVLFGQIGPVKGCRLIQEPSGDPYAFIEFSEHHAAATALAAMNGRNCFGKEMKVNWATSPTQSKPDTSKHYHIFVGDLSPEIETQGLREAFAAFGEISDCRVVVDPQTLKSKGYGFVSFVKKVEAEAAMAAMNGQWLGNRSIRTNWASRKLSPPKNESGGKGKQLTLEEVYNQSSPTNCTVYCGGITNGISEDLMQKTFSPFGMIQEVRVFKEKGYAFIRFATKESATHAIVTVHHTEVNGQTVKCSWGKESGDPETASASNQVPAQQYGYGAGAAAVGAQYPYFGQQMGYWYPQGYQAAAAAQQLQNQFLQGMAGYANGGLGYQQAYQGGQAQGIRGGADAVAAQQLAGAAAHNARLMQQF